MERNIKFIDEFSQKPLYLETLLNDKGLGVGTGFAVKKDDSYYIITNWHVVTGRDPKDNKPISKNGMADPQKLRVWFHGKKLGSWISCEINLIDQKGNKLWLEHVSGNEIDVVAIKFLIAPNIEVYDIDLSLSNFDLMIYPSEAVSIIGYPEGLTSAGMFPIWKTGHIASDIDLDWNGKPAFLIDATTKGGMSGSPVIAKRVSIYQTSKGNTIGNAVRFLGVYSGRNIGSFGTEIGIVWKPIVISEILTKK
ncbi:MAG: S1 family peptidase [Candidatus Nealsonbacteria bacterium]